MVHAAHRIFMVLPILLGGLLFTGGCMATYSNRNPVDESFPVARGESLERDSVELPTAYLGSPVVYMVGYVQSTQFDLDRWAIGFNQVEFPIRVVEVPTIPGLVPSMFRGMIDNGMRSGIPAEDWSAVVTLYGKQATPVARFTGNGNPRNGRILLVDGQGVVRWFWDQGFSASRLKELLEKASSEE